jgi:ABC-type sugar transport system permease subunit
VSEDKTSDHFKGIMNTRQSENRKAWIAYLFILPAFSVIGIFIVYPVFNLFYLSLFKASILGRTKFVGFGNFINLFSNQDFLSSVTVSLVFMVVTVVVQTLLALFVAFLVQNEHKTMGFFRTTLFIPVILSFVVVAYLWKYLYNPDFGLLASVFDSLGIPRQGFISDPKQALASLIVTCVWKSWPFFMMIFLAGLKEIPGELHECASIEGANAYQKAFYITLPLLRRTILFVVVVTTMDAVVRVFTPVFVMTDGGPRGATDLLIYFDWRQAFRLGDLGYASAIAVFLFFFVLAVSLVQLYVGREADG